MHKMVDLLNNIVKTYHLVAECPLLTSAEIILKNSSSDFINVLSRWKQRNVEKGEFTKFQMNHVLKKSSLDILFETTPVDTSSQELSKFSKSEKYHCVVREAKPDNKKKQFLEIWTSNQLLLNFDVSALDLHGDIYCDDEFGSLDWYSNDEKFLYIAEKKQNKIEPIYKQKLKEKFHPSDEKVSVGEEYAYRPDWGEQLVDKHQPVVVVCDIKAESIKILEGIPPNYSPAQVLWTNDGTGLYGVVFENEPRRLGLIYCTNRLSYIFHLSLKGEFKILSDKNKSVASPRLSLDGKSLYWLQRPVGGTHDGCRELVKLDLTTSKKEVLINIVRKGNANFSGLFLHSLPKRCFSKDGKKLFFSALNRTRTMSYYLDLGNKEVHALETGEGSSTILDVHEDMLLITTSTLQTAPCLKIMKSAPKIECYELTKCDIMCQGSVIKELEYDSKDPQQKFTYYNALYYGPQPPKSAGQTVPLILLPHGGPHSAISNSFSLDANFFVSLGYGVLMVNYRGSTGVGQDGIEFLQGKVGDTDVKDNHEAVLDILKKVSYLDPKNVFLYGKSHGGFLVEHLSAQYPDFYRAVVSSNPVTDVLSMYTMSDIPDWATAECNLPFDESKPLTLDMIKTMVVSSPAHLLNKIKAPTFFMIGKKDLRVPYYEGIKMYNALKARKVNTRLNLYDDNHSLASVPVHFDYLVHSALWFEEHKA